MIRRVFQLGARLGTVEELLKQLPDEACVADIGTDHGKLICSLLLHNEHFSCIASDFPIDVTYN